MQMNESEFLQVYDISEYDRPSVTADIAAFGIRNKQSGNYRRDSERGLSILLIRRGGHPYKDCWALPGGFMQRGETIEQCALREIGEETSVVPDSLMPVGVYSAPDRDPRGWIISESFVCVISEENVQERSGDDAADARWFAVSLNDAGEGVYFLTLESEEEKLECRLVHNGRKFGTDHFSQSENSPLAFDHAVIIAEALSKLQSCAESFEMIFDFLPESFTLSALQSVREAITGKTEQAANFRRKSAPYVVETQEFSLGAGHRPARLYNKRRCPPPL